MNLLRIQAIAAADGAGSAARERPEGAAKENTEKSLCRNK
jgi:hypothetical protein